MRVNHELFIEFSEKIVAIVSRNGNSDEESDMPQTKNCTNLKISCN